MDKADYTGRDQRLQYLFQNGGGGGTQCLYDPTAIANIKSGVITANAGIAEIIKILSGGGGGGGSSFEQLTITEFCDLSSTWVQG